MKPGIELGPMLPQRQRTILDLLRPSESEAFECCAKKAIEECAIDVDFVYPPPRNKTLLEMACCDGMTEIVDALVNRLGANPNKINDLQNRTPLHFAVREGHSRIVELLLKAKNPADPNVQVERQTALHIAVRYNHRECVRILLVNGANPNIVNSKGLTPIHLAATLGHRQTVQLILEESADRIPADIDRYRDFRKVTTRDILREKMPDLELPPPATLDDDDDEKYDPEEICRSCYNETDETRFLDKIRSIRDKISPTDRDELIKTAARRDYPGVVAELMKRGQLEGGSDDLAKCGSTTARIAVQLGHYNVLREILTIDSKLANELLIPACQELGVPTLSFRQEHTEDRIKCLRLIMEQPEVDVRCQDDKGNSPLHYAARAESAEAIGALLRSGCYIGHRNIFGVPPLAHMSPAVLAEFFDDCLHSDNDRTDDYEIKFDYRCLMPHGLSRPPEETNQEFSRGPKNTNVNDSISEMETLAYMAENRALRPLLKHPLVSSFLYIKWHRIRHVLYANFTFYVIFYALINSYVISTNYYGKSSSPTSSESSGLETAATTPTTLVPGSRQFQTLRSITTVALVILAIREILQLISSPWHYVSSFENILEVALVFLGGWVIFSPNPQIGAIVILLTAWELVILIGQHPRMSTGIEMFKTVSMNFARFLFLYAFLILAFALAFFTLFKDSENDDNFPDPGHSLFKTIIMLTGEFDANDIPFVSHPVLSHCIFVLFVFLIAIVLFNLLNGLAVSDTADILNKSELVALVSRTKLVAYAESVVIASGLMRLTGYCCSKSSILHWRFNSRGALSRRILVFPYYLPHAKISVKPYKRNEIRIYGRVPRTRTCHRLSMDPWIVECARQILSRRGVITENERFVNEFRSIKHKLDGLETMVEEMRRALTTKT